MIELYTAATPNGFKASIMLEESGLDYQVMPIDLGLGEQKEKNYLKLNPNGRIPTIVDRDPGNGGGDFAVFESGAILIYLADKCGKYLPTNTPENIQTRSRVVQWLMFQMAGIGPMMGQAGVFFRYAPEKIQYAIDRYQNESLRLLNILNKHLADNEYLAGDYSIADIATYPWAVAYDYIGVDIDGLDHLQDWLDRIGQRPAVQKGMAIPEAVDMKDEEKNAERASKVQGLLS